MLSTPQPKRQRRPMRIPQASEYVGGVITEKTFRQWIWLRRIEHVRIGRSVCIFQDTLDRLLEQGTVPALQD